mmetsp:Transcript_33191/g.50770  ORF Transcript_33191/g.50770 Transcript_33191/m.50770 type:complete len:228 (-) Transcript_33191:610-1293(-)
MVSAVSPLDASWMVQSGATRWMVRANSLRRIMSSSTKSTESPLGRDGAFSCGCSSLSCSDPRGTVVAVLMDAVMEAFVKASSFLTSSGEVFVSMTNLAPGLPSMPLWKDSSNHKFISIRSTSFLLKLSPMPVPWFNESRLDWNLENRRSRFSEGTPGPESSTNICTFLVSLFTFALRRMNPFWTNLLEFRDRFKTTCFRRRQSVVMTRSFGHSMRTSTLQSRRYKSE